MPKINKRSYHIVKNRDLEDTIWNFIKRQQYESITFATDVDKIKMLHHSENLKYVIVPSTVDTIDKSCFFGCSNIEEVILNEGIRILDGYVFSECKNLKKIIIPKSVRSIGMCCFSDCSNLEEVILQDGLGYIGTFSFKNCINLKKIDIPSSVKEIKMSCFKDCLNLERIVLPINMEYINPNVFDGCNNIKYVNYRSLNVKFLKEIEERLKNEKRTKINKRLNKEIMEKLFYFGKCKLFGIDYKQEYEEFIEYYINTYSVPNKDIVSLDKGSYLKKQDNKETKLIPWYYQCIPGFVILEDESSVSNKTIKPIDRIGKGIKNNLLPNVIEAENYVFDKNGNLWLKGKNGLEDDIMPKAFVKEFIQKNAK